MIPISLLLRALALFFLFSAGAALVARRVLARRHRRVLEDHVACSFFRWPIERELLRGPRAGEDVIGALHMKKEIQTYADYVEAILVLDRLCALGRVVRNPITQEFSLSRSGHLPPWGK